MPSRNIIRMDVTGAYYHVYARGGSRQPVFLDDVDKEKFLRLLERYLSGRVAHDKVGAVYPSYQNRISLAAYCLMSNHFHLLLRQENCGDLTAFMRSLMTSYVRYFNLRHKRSGSLFESRYKASLIYEDAYYVHISRYIHLNPRSWKYYPYSSIGFYRKGNEPNWLKTKEILHNFEARADYMTFLYDYEAQKAILDEIKHELADQ